jgi:hypothetical protein
MSIEWFRSWHGAPTDPKWILIAKRSETQPGVTSAIVWALFDHASQNREQRGCVDDFDVETYAAFSGFDEATITRVIECLKEKNIIKDGYLSAWEKRQPKREDNSTERVHKHRNAVKRSETQGNARVDKEKSREDKKDSEANASGAVAPTDPKFDEFWKSMPKRSGANPKAPAEKLFKAAVRGGADPDAIIAGAKRCAIVDAAKANTEFIPQTVKWLRDRRWLDYLAVDLPSAGDKLDMESAVKMFAKTRIWSRHAPCAEPGQSGCTVPPEMFEKYGLLPDGRKAA